MSEFEREVWLMFREIWSWLKELDWWEWLAVTAVTLLMYLAVVFAATLVAY